MKITPTSTLSDVLNNPVGYDVAQMVVYRSNLSNDVLVNPLYREKTIVELLGDKLSVPEIEQIISLMNLTTEKVIAKKEVDPRW